MTIDTNALVTAAAAVAVLLALVLLYQSAAGRKLLFDLAARIVGKLGERIEAHAIDTLDALAERLLDKLADRDGVAALDAEGKRYERATASSPFDKDLPY